jgi:hypothetical protein
MTSTTKTDCGQEISLPRAALVAGLGYLLTPTPFAEFYVYPHLVISGKIEQTAQNILAHQSLFAAGIVCYLSSFVCDVVIAWALYYLLKPVSASLSLLAAWFQLVYAAVGLSASLNLVTVLRLLDTPEDAALFGAGPLHAQIQLIESNLLCNSFNAGGLLDLQIRLYPQADRHPVGGCRGRLRGAEPEYLLVSRA